jgi:hypothetical protein
MKIKLLILTIILGITINCSKESSIPQKPIEYVIPDKNGFWEDGSGFYIKYKYVFREYEEKKRLVPIFSGTLPPVRYSDLKKLQSDPRVSAFGNIRVDVKPGEVKKTVLELVDFYSKEFKEENKKPTVIGAEDGEFIVWYDYTPNGVPFSIMLKFPATEEALMLDKIEDLDVEESGYIYATYSISPFRRSPFYKE